MPINWSDFVEIVNSHERFLLTSHVRPDCDSVGSELALALTLESLGKKVRIVNGHATPPNLAFVDPEKRIEVLGEHVQAAELIDSADVLVVLDTCSWAQLGPMGDVIRSTTAKKIVLDHHAVGDDIGALQFSNVQAEATGRLVAEAAEQLGVALTAEVATVLFAAVATDTGWFRFSSTNAQTYRLASRLIDAGANLQVIYRELYEQDTLGRIKLRGRILERFETDLDGRLVHTYVRATDFQETGALPSDTEDAINAGLAISGSEVAVILVEQPGGGFKVSFRSRSLLDCSKLAATFGGGGHKAAAGASVDKPFAAAQREVLDAVRREMKSAKGAEAATDRRTVLKSISASLASACAVGVAIPGTRYAVASLSRRSSGDAVVQRVPLDNLPPGKPIEMAITGSRRDAWTLYPEQVIGRLWLVRRTDEKTPPEQAKVDAFTSECPHLGCVVQLDVSGDRFVCSCHKAYFDFSGNPLPGQSGEKTPAPRPMDSLKCPCVVEEHTGQWWVEVTFEKFQLGIPDKVAKT